MELDRNELANLLTTVSVARTRPYPFVVLHALEKIAGWLQEQTKPSEVAAATLVLQEAKFTGSEIRRRDFSDPLAATIAMHRLHGSPIGWLSFTALVKDRGKTPAARQEVPNEEYAAIGKTMDARFGDKVFKAVERAVRPLDRNEIAKILSAMMARAPSRNDVTYVLHHLWKEGSLVPVAVPSGTEGKLKQAWTTADDLEREVR